MGVAMMWSIGKEVKVKGEGEQWNVSSCEDWICFDWVDCDKIDSVNLLPPEMKQYIRCR